MDIHAPAPPKPQRRRRSACFCLTVLCAVLGAVCVLAVLGAIGVALRGFIRNVRDPHLAHVHNATSGAASVRPLLGKGDRFDVVLSLWARVPDAEQPWRVPQAGDNESEWRATADARTIAAQSFTGLPIAELVNDDKEVNLFSEVLFRDFSLGDKDREAKVNVTIPLQHFYDYRLYNPDIRVALSVLPRPEVLDGLVNVSDWRPAGAGPRRRIPDNFAFSGAHANYDDPVRQEALERIALSFGLVRFKDTMSKCKVDNTTGVDEDDDNDDDVDEDEEASDSQGQARASPDFIAPPKEAPGGHPHITTRYETAIGVIVIATLTVRSHFYIIDETRHFDRKAFEKQHRALLQNSALPNAPVARQLCNRAYTNNGHWETQLEFEEGETRRLAYGPFIHWVTQGAGPRHLVPLPVSREACLNRTDDPETFTFEYSVRLSVMTPGRVHLVDGMFPITPNLVANATEKQIIDAHDTWEFSLGLLGSRTEGKHPWTRLVLNTIYGSAMLAAGVLDVLYWFTRATSTGISVFGTTLKGIEGAADLVGFADFMVRHADNLWIAAFTLVLYMWVPLAKLRGLQVVLPYEVQWRGWTPVGLQRRRWTHKERATRRIESAVSWAHGVGLVLAVWGGLYGLGRLNVRVVAPSHEHRDPDPASLFHNDMFHAWQFGMKVAGQVLQLYVNHKARTYAGSYALGAYCALAGRVAYLLYYLDRMTGPIDTRDPIYPHVVLDTIVEAVTAYQAATLPRVEQVEDDESA